MAYGRSGRGGGRFSRLGLLPSPCMMRRGLRSGAPYSPPASRRYRDGDMLISIYRLRTRIAFTQGSEESLEAKRQHCESHRRRCHTRHWSNAWVQISKLYRHSRAPLRCWAVASRRTISYNFFHVCSFALALGVVIHAPFQAFSHRRDKTVA